MTGLNTVRDILGAEVFDKIATAPKPEVLAALKPTNTSTSYNKSEKSKFIDKLNEQLAYAAKGIVPAKVNDDGSKVKGRSKQWYKVTNGVITVNVYRGVKAIPLGIGHEKVGVQIEGGFDGLTKFLTAIKTAAENGKFDALLEDMKVDAMRPVDSNAATKPKNANKKAIVAPVENPAAPTITV